MVTAIIISIVIIAAYGYARWSGREDGLIVRRPYNNRHNDASGARDESFG